MRSVRPDRRSSGVPTSASRRARARDTPDWVTRSSSLTSVTVTPSATCWNQRTASVSTCMTLAHGNHAIESLDAWVGPGETERVNLIAQKGPAMEHRTRLSPLWNAARDDLRTRRASRASRGTLERELASYTTPT